LLLVDDNAQLLDFYKLVLEQAGHQVLTAETCGRAVALLAETDPEIVIMDLRVPEMADGLGLIRTLKDRVRPQGRDRAKVIVISGWIEDLFETPEKDSVDCVLSKPVRMEILLRSIARLALMVLLCLAGARSLAAETFRFNVKSRAEVVATLEMSSPGSNWAETGREAALVTLVVDRHAPQHVMLYAGDQNYSYAAFLGKLAPGEHELRVERDTRHSALKSGGTWSRQASRKSCPEILAGPRWPMLRFSTHAPIRSGASTISR
jgi:CheY-like chemotaxis protein